MERFNQKITLEKWPGFERTLFRDLGQRIRHPQLEPDSLPPAFLIHEGHERGGRILFLRERFDLNITVFKPQPAFGSRDGRCGVFVISNGAGVACNMVDQLAPQVPVAGLIDLKRGFLASKILAALRMACSARPGVEVIVVNIISGIALGRETAKAVAEFSEETKGTVPVILRFKGPRMHESRPVMRALRDGRDHITLVDSTTEAMKATRALLNRSEFEVEAETSLDQRVHDALSVRAQARVTMSPEDWLSPERTLHHLFGSKTETRFGILGFGTTARFQIRSMVRENVRIAWVATPSADKHRLSDVEGVRIFRTVGEAVAVAGDVDIVLNYAPARHTLEATRECLSSSAAMRLMILVAENIPDDQTIQVMEALENAEVNFIGPNSPGIMIVEPGSDGPDWFKIGNIPAFIFSRPGGLSVVGRSGTAIFDVVDEAVRAGIGVRLAWAVGGDRYTGLGFIEALAMLEQDPQTQVIVLNGEAGGIQEQMAAQMIATGLITKPVIALVTGKTLPVGVEYGHQGSIKFTRADDPYVKEDYLERAGVICVDSPRAVAEAVQMIERIGWDLPQRRRTAHWEHKVQEGAASGLHWQEAWRPAFEHLYDLAGPYLLHRAYLQSPDFLRELVGHIHALGVDTSRSLLQYPIRPEALVTGFKKNVEYIAKLIRGIKEIGPENFVTLVDEILTEPVFNAALASTPWAAADVLNEAHEIGIPETRNVIRKTMGIHLFRRLFSEKPWNTAHALRSINNMRWRNYVKAFHRYCTYLVGDRQLILASWAVNPWASVKLVRGYDRIPERGLERALEDPSCLRVFMEKSRTDPQGLLDLGKAAFEKSQADQIPFHEAYREIVLAGVPEKPAIEQEIETMGASDFNQVVDRVFTPAAFETGRRDHPTSTAQALRIINREGREDASGARRMVRIFMANEDILRTPSFYLAVSRNPWMTVDILRSIGNLAPGNMHRLVDYVLTQSTFDYSVAEHQWGTSQTLKKIADLGTGLFFDAYRILEEATHDRESFREGFKKNPRDALEIIQVIHSLGGDEFALLMAHAGTRTAFLNRMQMNPRHAAHFLQEVAVMGVFAFNDFVNHDFGRETLNAMLNRQGCNLVHALRRTNRLELHEFRDAYQDWKSSHPSEGFTPANALDLTGLIQRRVLDRRISSPGEAIRVELPGQPAMEVSPEEIRGCYRAYPEWGDVLFKALQGQALEALERIDLYHLVNGRKRLQALITPGLRPFMSQSELRKRINRGDALIPELSSLKGVPHRPPHRFDVYDHTMEILDQLQNTVFMLDFLSEPAQVYVKRELAKQIDGAPRSNLLVLAATLHDLGKADGEGAHVSKGVAAAEPILVRLGLTRRQQKAVLTTIAYHSPGKLKQKDETWEAFRDRGGLDLLFDEIWENGKNPYSLETILHYHADILGRHGQETPDSDIERRGQVTRYLVGRLITETRTVNARQEGAHQST